MPMSLASFGFMQAQPGRNALGSSMWQRSPKLRLGCCTESSQAERSGGRCSRNVSYWSILTRTWPETSEQAGGAHTGVRYKTGVVGSSGNGPKKPFYGSHTSYAEFRVCCQGGCDKGVRGTAKMAGALQAFVFAHATMEWFSSCPNCNFSVRSISFVFPPGTKLEVLFLLIRQS